MSTQLEAALQGRITPEMSAVAKTEGVDPEALARAVAEGAVAIPSNKNRGRDAAHSCGVGRGLRTKTNANIGTSKDSCDIETERAKLRAAEAAGADSVMDLSTAGDLRALRRQLLSETSMLFGTVPVYEAAVEAASSKGSVLEMSPDAMVDAVRRHAEDGVDFVTVHCGITRRSIASLGDLDQKGPRICGVVSRGGSFLSRWIHANDAENPFYDRYDELLEIAREYDVTLSLGDGLRPGAIADAGDEAQMAELVEISSLVRRARAAGVQTIVEGPGHVPLHEVRSQIETAKKLTLGAPLYVLGPIVTDVAAGYDHIAAAIGGAIAGWSGADFLCVVTPAEHLSLPNVDDIRRGVVAARIAAHAADVAVGLPQARMRDDEVSRARRSMDWEGVISRLLDPERARCVRDAGPPNDPATCSMCGPYCVFRPPVESPAQ
jgi:phosphomethylpyrimidine synthase